MKKLTQLLIAIFVILFLNSCQTEQGILEKETIILIDGTDKLSNISDFENFKKKLLPENTINGAKFRCGIINDIEYSGIVETELKPKLTEDETHEEIYGRRNAFIKKCQQGYVNQTKSALEKNYSIIYSIIVKQLNELSQSRAKVKTLYIYSDLYENSDLLNVYNPKQFKDFKKHKSKYIQQFETKYPLQNLSGIEIYFLYKPKDFNDNMKYKELHELYLQILNNKGAKCLTI